MANDILWIRHRRTGDVIPFMKFYPNVPVEIRTKGTLRSYILPSRAELDLWMEDHFPFAGDLGGGDGGFEFITDSDDRLKLGGDSLVRTDPDV